MKLFQPLDEAEELLDNWQVPTALGKEVQVEKGERPQVLKGFICGRYDGQSDPHNHL